MRPKTPVDPKTLYPIEGITRTVFLKNIIKNPQILVGDYTYDDRLLEQVELVALGYR